MSRDIEFFEQALEVLAAYAKAEDRGDAVVQYRDAKDAAGAHDFSLGESKDTDAMMAALQDFLDYSIDAGHPQYFNQLWGGRDLPSVVGEFMATICNTSMATYEIAPMATLMEREVIRKMGALARFTDPDGIMCTGGSNGNQLALMCALYQTLDGYKADGLMGQEKPLACFVSDQAHYSFLKSAATLGLGQKHVITVQSDDTGRMMPGALEAAIEKSIAEGHQPFFIGATSGTTVRGAFDPLEALADISEKYGLWLHVDGAYGGSVLLSKAQCSVFNGLERADSFVWDAHKMMGVPLIASVFLLNNKPGMMRDVFNSDSGAYIFHDYENERYDFGPQSLQCGRRNDAAKLWMAWQFHGDAGYEARIDHLFAMADYVVEKIEGHPKLEMVFPHQYVNICFRYLPDYEADLNLFNEEARSRLLQTGEVMVNHAFSKDTRFFRLILANPKVTERDLDRFLDKLVENAAELERDGFGRQSAA